MLLAAVAVVLGAAVIMGLMWKRRPEGLAYLGSVSERWIAEARASANDRH